MFWRNMKEPIPVINHSVAPSATKHLEIQELWRTTRESTLLKAPQQLKSWKEFHHLRSYKHCRLKGTWLVYQFELWKVLSQIRKYLELHYPLDLFLSLKQIQLMLLKYFLPSEVRVEVCPHNWDVLLSPVDERLLGLFDPRLILVDVLCQFETGPTDGSIVASFAVPMLTNAS